MQNAEYACASDLVDSYEKVEIRHNFQDCINPVCSCGQEIESSTYFHFHCFNYRCAKQNLC